MNTSARPKKKWKISSPSSWKTPRSILPIAPNDLLHRNSVGGKEVFHGLLRRHPTGADGGVVLDDDFDDREQRFLG